MASYIIYDSAGNIHKTIGGSAHQMTEAFIANNTPAGMQALEVKPARFIDSQKFKVSNGQIVAK